jgi:hypothetical protein
LLPFIAFAPSATFTLLCRALVVVGAVVVTYRCYLFIVVGL